MQTIPKMNRSRQSPVALLIAAVLSAVVVAGCGSNDRAAVSGKVTHNGQPVSGGSITFAPVASSDGPRQPAMGRVDSEGAFTLSTESEADGILIGSYEVFYNPPVTSEDPTATSPYAGLAPKQAQVEVVPGDNVFQVELGPKR